MIVVGTRVVPPTPSAVMVTDSCFACTDAVEDESPPRLNTIVLERLLGSTVKGSVPVAGGGMITVAVGD